MRIEFVFAEFGNDQKCPVDNVLKYFPDAKINLRHNQPCPDICDRKHKRWGWRMNDYYQLIGMLESDADLVIAMDADKTIVSDRVLSIMPLAQKFGFCAPVNPRLLVSVDTLIGADSDGQLDETLGTGYAFNSSFLALWTKNVSARKFVQTCIDLMRNDPKRLPLILWRAAYQTGFNPYMLPPQWCVCEGQEGCGGEIILHVGHEPVRRYYGHAISQ